MQLDSFLSDATGASWGVSDRQKHIALAQMLTEDGEPATAKMVEQWFVRKNIPTKWVFAVVKAAKAVGRTLDLNDYAPIEQEFIPVEDDALTD